MPIRTFLLIKNLDGREREKKFYLWAAVPHNGLVSSQNNCTSNFGKKWWFVKIEHFFPKILPKFYWRNTSLSGSGGGGVGGGGGFK